MQKLRPFAGMLFVMIALIMMGAMPSRAYAHAGHVHATPVADVQSEAAPDAGDARGIVQTEIQQEFAASAERPATPDIKPGCVGGCCSNSHTCCAFTFVKAQTGENPVWTWTRHAPVNLALPDGVDPSAQRKPPRSIT